MRKRAFVVAALMSGLAGIVLAGPGYARDASATVPTRDEAWYATSQCALPTGCGALGRAAPASPYPANTLHVGVAAGAETDRTYLSLDVTSIAIDVTLNGGALTIPLDTAPTDGSQAASGAHVDACLVTAPFQSVQGSFAAPPPATCTVRAPAVYADTGGPARLVVDLSSLVSHWTPSSAALALVPAQAAIDAHETWHVAFSARDRANPPSAPASAELTYSQASNDSSAASDEAASSGGTSPTTFNDTPVFTSPPAAFQPDSAPSREEALPPSPSIAFASPAEPAAVTEPQQPAASVTPLGARPYQYPLVWLVPLALVAGVGMIGRSLTRDLR